ncbi:MAG: BACON domain-containing carbohydrate-binding protein, partial [Candidatus Parabeggiatoa sp.]|nr:BACON domain-containing carbohydrate-binding protein [Candidatus Parabeggiatoa sp.]
MLSKLLRDSRKGSRRSPRIFYPTLFALLLWLLPLASAISETVTEPIRTFQGHSDSVFSVAFSPDGKKALSGSTDHTLKLWDIASGQLIRTFQGHSDDVQSVVFSPNGSQALSGSNDGTLKLWEIASGNVIRTFQGHSRQVSSVTFSFDGKKALSGSYDGTLKLWDVSSGQLIRSFQGDSNRVNSVALSPDGSMALSGSDGGTLKLWDMSSGQLIRSFQGHSEWVRAVVFSADGKKALSGGFDGTKLWDIVSGQLIRSFQDGQFSVLSVAFSPDGKLGLSSYFGGSIKLWDISSDQVIHSFQEDNIDSDYYMSVTFSPDGSLALSGGTNKNMLHLWDIPCVYNISPTSRAHSFNNEIGDISVTVSPSQCSWKAQSHRDWLTITSGNSRQGTGTVTYSVQGNNSLQNRIGLLTIAGENFIINQDALIQYQLIVNKMSTSGSITGPGINCGTDCSEEYDANSTVTLIATPDNNSTFQGWGGVCSGTGICTVTMNQAQNVMASFGGCTYSLTPNQRIHGFNAETGYVTVSAPLGCSWTASSNNSLLANITAGAIGQGNGTVIYEVLANPSLQNRQGTLTIAGQIFTLKQGEGECTYSITPLSHAHSANAETGNVTVMTTEACPWSAQSNQAWATITSGLNGQGTSTVIYSITANTSTENRQGTLTIAGQTFTFNQGTPGNTPPIHVISVTPSQGTSPLTVTADGRESYDREGIIKTYGWTTSDGQIAATPKAAFTFTTVGTYNITLTVTD